MKHTPSSSHQPGPFSRFRRAKLEAGHREMRIYPPADIAALLERTVGAQYHGRQSTRGAAVLWLEKLHEALISAGAIAGDAPVNPEELVVEVRLKSQ